MRSRVFVLVSIVAVLAVAAVAVGALRDPLAGIDPPEPATERGRAHAFDVERVATGFNRPTWVGVAPGDPRSLWVLEQPGRVVRWRDGRRRTVLDLTGQVTTGSEQGLLGLAFHPEFATDRRLYLNWSDERGDTRVAEFRDGRRAPRAACTSASPSPTTTAAISPSGPTAACTSAWATAAAPSTPAPRPGPRRQARQAALHRRRPDPDWRSS